LLEFADIGSQIAEFLAKLLPFRAVASIGFLAADLCAASVFGFEVHERVEIGTQLDDFRSEGME